MSLARTPLDLAVLPGSVGKVVEAAGPAKMMAARGLLPLPRASDMLAVLYMLALDPEASIAQAASKTAAELPDKVLVPGLADATVDPRVIDFFAARAAAIPAAAEALLLNKQTSDDTVRDICSKLDERNLELVAQNEQRLLRAPQVIAALYLNPRTRMSTVDRAVELAVRNKLTVPGIPAWDDVVIAVLGTPASPRTADDLAAADAAFADVSSFAIGDANVDDAILDQLLADGEDDPALTAVELNAERDQKKVQISKLSIPGKIRLATLGNAFARATLIRDTNRQVQLAAIKSPGVTENEVVKYSSNRALSDDVIRIIANDKQWTRLYQVKMNLIFNPKCPLAVAMRLLPFMHEKDVARVAKSKGISSALATQARKLSLAKSGGNK